MTIGTCSHERIWWDLAWSDRVVVRATVRDVATIELRLLRRIGAHARRALGERAAAWQIVEWTLPIIRLAWPGLPPRPTVRDLQPIIDVAVGGALVSLRVALPDRPANPDQRDGFEQVRGIVVRGALVALRRAADEISPDLREAGDILTGSTGRRTIRNGRRPASAR